MIARRVLSALVLFSILFSASLFAQGLEYVPLGDPVYSFLEYAETSGTIRYLPRVRPYLARDVVAMLEEASASRAGDEWLRGRAAAHLERIRGGSRRELVRGRFSDDGSIAVGVATDLTVEATPSRIGDSVATFSIPFDLSISLGDTIHVGLGMVAAFEYLAWEESPYPRYGEPLLWDYYNYTYLFGEETGGFNHGGYHEPGREEFRILFDTTNQFSVDLDYLVVHAGRQALDWGPARSANLILSGTSKPYDFIGFDLPLGGSGTFSWATAILHDFAFARGLSLDERLLTAHRIEYRITDWLLAAIYESVIYDFTFELAYLNPLSIYYITEVTQGSGDNKLGGVDLVVTLPGLSIYGSFFADDWDAGHMFNLASSHNEWAGVLGVSSAGLLPGLTVGLEAVYLSHWMYTHYTWEDLSSVGKSYQHYGANLGHYLDQNSWMIELSGRYDHSIATWASASFRIIQDGRGDINTPPDWSAESELHDVSNYRDIVYSFLDRGKPGFTIDTTIDATLRGRHEFSSLGLAVEGRYTVQHSFTQETELMTRVADSAHTDHFLTLEVSFVPGALF